MKDAASAPTPVDPTVAANAQSASNIATAQAQQKLNMSNTAGPNGSVTYGADPNSPSGYTQTTALSPTQQALYDAQTGIQQQALGVAGDQVGRVNTALAAGPVSGGAIQQVSPQGQIGSTYGSGGNIQYGFDPGQALTQTYSQGSPIQTSVGNTAVQGQIASGGPIQGNIGQQGPITGDFSQGQAVQGSVAPTDWNGAVNNVTDAVWQQALSRLQPQQTLQNSQLSQKLADQGLSANSAAYQNQQGILGRNQNDANNQALFSAIQQGANEQNVLQQQAVAAGNFANSAAGQQYSQNQGEAAFQNAAQQQGYTQALGAGDFANAAQAQGFGQTQAQGQFANQAAGQQFSQGVTQGQFANQAAGQQNTQNAAQAAFQNAAAGQQYTQNAGEAAFNNTAQQQANSQSMAAQAFANTAQQQAYQQQLAASQANNAAQAQTFQQAAYNENQPINQLSSLLGLSQVQAPAAQAVPQGTVGNTDVLGAYALNAQQQQAAYQAQMQQQNALLGGLFSLGSAGIMASDIRLKHDIRRVGTRKDGLGIYRFKYIGSDIPHIGVMAQEVLWVKPKAVSIRQGFFAVDYTQLGGAA